VARRGLARQRLRVDRVGQWIGLGVLSLASHRCADSPRTDRRRDGLSARVGTSSSKVRNQILPQATVVVCQHGLALCESNREFSV